LSAKTDRQRPDGLAATLHVAPGRLKLAKLIEVNPFFNNEAFEATLERLHRAAYPVASTRPARLTAGDLADIRE
jgi:hypothetical protein